MSDFQQVRESDLVSLISNIYFEFVFPDFPDLIEQRDEYKNVFFTQIKVNSAFITLKEDLTLTKTRPNRSLADPKFLNIFKEKLEEITFGRLKVLYSITHDKLWSIHYVITYIAIGGYQLID